MDEGIKMKGKVKSLRKDGRAVLIETDAGEAWLDLAENVKPQYIKTGSNCDFTYLSQGDGNGLLVYIKCESSGYAKPGFNQGYKKPEEFRKPGLAVDEATYRMNATKSAAMILEGKANVPEFEALTDKILNYIKTGEWNNAKKAVQQGELPQSSDEDNY